MFYNNLLWLMWNSEHCTYEDLIPYEISKVMFPCSWCNKIPEEGISEFCTACTEPIQPITIIK